MLPQLDTTTFHSQIFWVVWGFVCVYVFIATVATPQLKRIFENRQKHVDDLCEVAKNLKEESERLQITSNEILEKVKNEIYETETKLLNDFDKKNSEEKLKLTEEFSEAAKNEVSSLKLSSQEVLHEVSTDYLDKFLDLAMQKLENTK